jgi:uncharacterized protein (TIGR03086 family)
MELYEAFDHAVASTAGTVKAVRPDQAGAPTPCTEWDVRDLLSHIIGTLWLSEALLSDHTPRHPMAPGGLPGADLAGRDPAAAYAEASAAALAAASAGDTLTRVHTTPLGDMPGPALAGFTTLDIAVHGWDLAQATGQETERDPELALWALTTAKRILPPDIRGDAGVPFGPVVEVSPDATPYAQLAAWLGRRP